MDPGKLRRCGLRVPVVRRGGWHHRQRANGSHFRRRTRSALDYRLQDQLARRLGLGGVPGQRTGAVSRTTGTVPPDFLRHGTPPRARGSVFSATGRVAGSGARAGAGRQGHIRGDRMAFRFIHAADIHLDSPLLSLEEYPGAPLEEIRLATRRALAGLVDLAIASAVSFVVIAGDLFDGEWRDCNTGLYFVAEMKRLRTAGIPVYISLGNHDA